MHLVDNFSQKRKVLILDSDKKKKFTYFLNEPISSKGICFFIHGIGDSSTTFSKLINTAYLEEYSTLYYDLPGFGINKNIKIKEFKDNFEILSSLIYLHSQSTKNNCFVGHSMVGLILLLTLVNQDFITNKFNILTIEPSITPVDLDFFRHIQEPPIGIGYDGFVENSKSHIGQSIYSKEYYDNLTNSSDLTFKKCVKDINDNFFVYQSLIFQSKMPFIYTYGQRSLNPNFRENIKQHSNIEVKSFHMAKHWVHIDAEKEFCDFFTNDFLNNNS
ncbi:MAG: hypothetical protein DCF12_22195 [Snowella sp.]|nr:MAG: hypothetical protein DCF12_22195 [Snowella sp.]